MAQFFRLDPHQGIDDTFFFHGQNGAKVKRTRIRCSCGKLFI